MTKNLSTTALGLIFGAALLKIWAIPFTKWASANYEFFAFQFAINKLNPVIHDVVNMSAVFPAIYIALCLGAGLLLACAMYVCSKVALCVSTKTFKYLSQRIKQLDSTVAIPHKA